MNAEQRGALLCRNLDCHLATGPDDGVAVAFYYVGELLGGLGETFSETFAEYLDQKEQALLDEWPDTPEHRFLAWQNRQNWALDFIDAADRVLAPLRKCPLGSAAQ